MYLLTVGVFERSFRHIKEVVPGQDVCKVQSVFERGKPGAFDEEVWMES